MKFRSNRFLAASCVLAVSVLGLSFSVFAEGGHRLNNLVVELCHMDSMPVDSTQAITFFNPRDGWIYSAFDAETPSTQFVELINADTPEPVVFLRKDAGTPGRVEAMRLFTKGEHRLRFRGEGVSHVQALTIRTMPETHYVRYPDQPKYPQLGNFDWPWLKKHVLSSVNTVVGFPSPKISPEIDEWIALGRKFISYGSLPHDEGLTGPMAFDSWYKNPGFQDPRISGMIADEFNGRQHPFYPAWTEGMRLLGEKTKGTGKQFYAYCGGPGMYSRPEARKLVHTVFDSGFYIAWERYHHEMPTLGEAKELMDKLLGKEMTRWQAEFPQCQRQMVMVLGLFATGPDLDVQPQVNYKVWMDMQMQYLATNPLYDGLYGVHWWYAGASSEEILRWESALYRHYCIEGRTDLLSESRGWTYALDHVQNPDFSKTLEPWEVQPAASDTMQSRYLERYAQVENRYWHRGEYPDDPAGNTYLWTKRQADKPNQAVQTIRNLVPDKLYTVQMITSDYQDIIQGKSEQKQHAVSLVVDGAEILPEGGYQSVAQSSPWSHEQLPFKNGPAWFNHHRVMFRAKSPTARLTISDWAGAGNPGGPVGQELMFNYIQVQPYYEEN